MIAARGVRILFVLLFVVTALAILPAHWERPCLLPSYGQAIAYWGNPLIGTRHAPANPSTGERTWASRTLGIHKGRTSRDRTGYEADTGGGATPVARKFQREIAGSKSACEISIQAARETLRNAAPNSSPVHPGGWVPPRGVGRFHH